jgi:Ca2+/Na+ antiporter
LFNVLVITGASALARPVKVAFATVTRDVIAYTLSLGLLLWAFWDSYIEFYEAAVFLSFYAVYIGVLAFWRKMFNRDEDPIVAVEEMVETRRDREGGALQRVSRVVDGVYQVLVGDARSQFVRAFIVSIVLISALSWVLVESGIAFATALGVPPVIVALTILAGGTSVPDMISSIVVARQGRGDMAIANAVGSNVFDVLVGLGLPWLIMIIAGRGTIAVGTQELKTSMWLLFGSVVMLYVFLITKRTLSKTEGLILVGAYIVYVAWMYATVG